MPSRSRRLRSPNDGEETCDVKPEEVIQRRQDKGFYRVVVQTSPPKTVSKVEVPGEKNVQLEVN